MENTYSSRQLVLISFGHACVLKLRPVSAEILQFPDLEFRVYNFLWLKITDEGLLPEMRIWSILLIYSDLKWCIHRSKSLFSYYTYKVEEDCHVC